MREHLLVNDWLNIPQKRAPVKVPSVVLSLSLPENYGKVSIYAHPLTGIYAVREWRIKRRCSKPWPRPAMDWQCGRRRHTKGLMSALERKARDP